MTLLQKSIGVLFVTSLAGVVCAQSMFDITLSNNFRPLDVSATAVLPYLVPYTVTSHLNIATPITLGFIRPAGGGDAFSVPYSECTSLLAFGATCSFNLGIVGTKLLNDATASPLVTGMGGQVSSQATSKNRVQVSLKRDPSPPGDPIWLPFPIRRWLQDKFMQKVATNPTQFKVATASLDISTNKPVITLASLFDPTDATIAADGLESYHFSQVTDLAYDATGNLYATFIQSAAENGDSVKSFVMTLAAGSATWTTLGKNAPISGIARSFLITSNGLAVTGISAENGNPSSFVQVLDFEGNTIAQKTFSGQAAFSYITSDAEGNLFVAGEEENSDINQQSYSYIWRLNSVNRTFTQLSLPIDMLVITGLVSDNRDTIYYSGLDVTGKAAVFGYNTKEDVFSDTNIKASYVGSLAYSAYGYPEASGRFEGFTAGVVWSLNSDGTTWTNLNLPDSGGVVAIASNANNDTIAFGVDSQNNPTAWLLAPTMVLQ